MTYTSYKGNIMPLNMYKMRSKKDRPHMYKEVLVFIDGIWEKGFWYSFDKNMDEVWLCGGKRFFPDENKITHWMELPEKPNRKD